MYNDIYSYDKVINIINKFFENESMKEKLIIAGGVVPYILYNEKSSRKHGDLDLICDIKDINYIRNYFQSLGCYIKEKDSLNYFDNDYGFELYYEDVKVGVYPFEEIKGNIKQCSYDSDTREIKVKYVNLSSEEYVNTNEYRTMVIEVILKSKIKICRDKDKLDIDVICANGFDSDLYKKIIIVNK